MAEECISDTESTNLYDSEVDELGDDNLYNLTASHANVFRVRTTKNQTFSLVYFFNCGSLDG